MFAPTEPWRRCSEARDLHVGSGPGGRGAPPYGRSTAWSWRYERGEILALAGESGCGKTTLARTLLGLERPWRGEVRHHGTPLSYSDRALRAYRRQVQLVLQDPTGALNPRRTVYEAVAEGLRIHRVPGDERAKVAQALSQAGLRPAESYFGRYPHELSGGQRQRVVIAGALALDPELIVADEPVSSLDASVRGEILALLLSLRDTLGLTVLVVTHDLGLAWNIADRLAVMYLGRIVEVGTTEQLLDGAEAPLHRGAAVGAARDGPPAAGHPAGRAARPAPHPVWLPVPSALPGACSTAGPSGPVSACRCRYRARSLCCRPRPARGGLPAARPYAPPRPRSADASSPGRPLIVRRFRLGIDRSTLRCPRPPVGPSSSWAFLVGGGQPG